MDPIRELKKLGKAWRKLPPVTIDWDFQRQVDWSQVPVGQSGCKVVQVPATRSHARNEEHKLWMATLAAEAWPEATISFATEGRGMTVTWPSGSQARF